MREKIPAKMTFAKDEFGKEVLLKDGKFQVMMEWEKPYMEACIDALRPSGDVLEIGFGCGYSARRIQKYHPKSHTIIECDPVVCEKARLFAQEHPGVVIVEDTWQNAFARLGVFDVIFFDDYPLESDETLSALEEEKKASHALLAQGNDLLREVKKLFPHIHQIRYTDADLEGFLEQVLKSEETPKEHIVHFFEELKTHNQIDCAQYDRVWQKLTPLGFQKKEIQMEKKSWVHFRGPNEKVYLFLEEALKNHMRKGSRFSCFLSSSLSKLEDPKFFQEIILNPYLDYHEEKIAIEVPKNCTYYTDKEALVMVITLQKSL